MLEKLAARIIVRTIALSMACLGARVLVGVALDLVRHDASPAGVVFRFGFASLCLLLAIRGWNARTARSLRWLCALAACAAFHLAFNGIDTAFARITGFSIFAIPSEHPTPRDDLIPEVFFLALAIIVIIGYRVLVAWLLPRLNLPDDRTPAQRLAALKWSLGIATFAVIGFGAVLAQVVSIRPVFQTRESANPGQTFLTLAAIAISVSVYERAVWRARRGSRGRAAPASPKTDMP